MHKAIYFIVIPGALGSGLICMTMHLANTSRNFSNNLKSLNINDKPEIDEHELRPPEPPQEITSNPPEEPPSPPEKSSSPEESQENSAASQDQESKPVSADDTKGTTDIQEAIRQCASKISTSPWTTERMKTLSTTYDIWSTIIRCQTTFQQHSKEMQTKTQTSSGEASGENVEGQQD